MEKDKYEIIKFEDGEFSIDVNVSKNENTIWLTQYQMSLLFETSKK